MCKANHAAERRYAQCEITDNREQHVPDQQRPQHTYRSPEPDLHRKAASDWYYFETKTSDLAQLVRGFLYFIFQYLVKKIK